MWHEPLFTCGGGNPPATQMQPYWTALANAHTDFVFNGHNHYYQRWQPLDASGAVDTANGLVEIVAGDYGVDSYTVCSGGESRLAAGTGSGGYAQIGGDSGLGVLFVDLSSDGSWAFEYRLQSGGAAGTIDGSGPGAVAPLTPSCA